MIYGTERTKAEAMSKLIENRRITFPVLLDPKRAYRDAANLAAYPTATLLDGDGKVVWLGQTYYRKPFADACEARIESLLDEK